MFSAASLSQLLTSKQAGNRSAPQEPNNRYSRRLRGSAHRGERILANLKSLKSLEVLFPTPTILKLLFRCLRILVWNIFSYWQHQMQFLNLFCGSEMSPRDGLFGFKMCECLEIRAPLCSLSGPVSCLVQNHYSNNRNWSEKAASCYPKANVGGWIRPRTIEPDIVWIRFQFSFSGWMTRAGCRDVVVL